MEAFPLPPPTTAAQLLPPPPTTAAQLLPPPPPSLKKQDPNYYVMSFKLLVEAREPRQRDQNNIQINYKNGTHQFNNDFTDIANMVDMIYIALSSIKQKYGDNDEIEINFDSDFVPVLQVIDSTNKKYQGEIKIEFENPKVIISPSLFRITKVEDTDIRVQDAGIDYDEESTYYILHFQIRVLEKWLSKGQLKYFGKESYYNPIRLLNIQRFIFDLLEPVYQVQMFHQNNIPIDISSSYDVYNLSDAKIVKHNVYGLVPEILGKTKLPIEIGHLVGTYLPGNKGGAKKSTRKRKTKTSKKRRGKTTRKGGRK